MKKNFALALGGGGTRGAYQLGAWKALLEIGIEIDAIVGTSVGAINGALFIQGDLKNIEKIYSKMDIKDFLEVSPEVNPDKDIFHISNIFFMAGEYIKQRGISNEPLKKMLEKYLDENIIYKSDLDYGVSTFSVDDFKSIEVFKEDMKKGELVDYILASACFPIYKAQKVSNKKFVDGGTADNLPINMLAQKGYKNIIAIDLKGVGIHKKTQVKDLYIKTIKPSENLGGIFEFNHERIMKNIKLGYLDTLKTFAKLQGDHYYFKLNSYKKMLNEFPVNTVNSFEFAAKEYNIDRLTQYSKEKFLKKLLKTHNDSMKEYTLIKDNLSKFKFVKKELDKNNKFDNKSLLLCYFVDMLRNNPVYLAGRDALLFEEHFKAAKALIELENR